MTLIVCFKAVDCIVVAADSLTSLGGRIVSCTTEKIYQVATDAVIASCGLSRVQGVGRQNILANFPMQPPGTNFGTTASQLHAFLDGVIKQVPKSNVGACQGGNTFLLAGYDGVNSGMTVAKMTRLGDRRHFEPMVTVSIVTRHDYIEWIGDTRVVSHHIASQNKLYKPNMSQNSAIKFAVDTIINGIAASLTANNSTIGGDFVSVAVVSDGGVTFSRRATGIHCAVAAPMNNSPATPNNFGTSII